ncbi:antibiotic biosynthesis monooxygenase [Kosakonia cowanii]|nr:antibiotic biosynthesis monooxygenase [Kosakonia cowanii]
MVSNKIFDKNSCSDDEAVYLINVVHVEDGLQDLAISILKDAVEYVSKNYSSFKWSRLMKSLDGKTVINQAQWGDRAEFESIFEDQNFLSLYSQLKKAGTWEYHVYTVAEYITPNALPE